MDEPSQFFTIGHSIGTFEDLLAVLIAHRIEMLVDVRRHPRNPFIPQFDRDRIKMELVRREIVYVFLGETLGQQDNATVLEREGSPIFQEAIDWLIEQGARHRTCLLSGPADPEKTHRDYLIAQNLLARGRRVLHIMPDRSLVPASPDLFHLPPDR